MRSSSENTSPSTRDEVLADTTSRNERRKGYWNAVKWTALGTVLLLAVLVSLNKARRLWGMNAAPARDAVAMISINGGIGGLARHRLTR